MKVLEQMITKAIEDLGKMEPGTEEYQRQADAIAKMVTANSKDIDSNSQVDVKNVEIATTRIKSETDLEMAKLKATSDEKLAGVKAKSDNEVAHSRERSESKKARWGLAATVGAAVVTAGLAALASAHKEKLKYETNSKILSAEEDYTFKNSKALDNR